MAKKTIYFLTLVCAVSSALMAGCSRTTEPEAAKAINTVQAPPPSNSPAALPAASNASAPDRASNTNAAVNGKMPSVPTKQPTPQIGSGGSDFSLFTQVRGQLSSDKELSTAVIVDVKEGIVTLNGSVSSQEQKSKAEQIVQSVKGIRSIKNNLRVSS